MCKEFVHDLLGLYANPLSLIPSFDTPLSHHQFEFNVAFQLCFYEHFFIDGVLRSIYETKRCVHFVDQKLIMNASRIRVWTSWPLHRELGKNLAIAEDFKLKLRDMQQNHGYFLGGKWQWKTAFATSAKTWHDSMQQPRLIHCRLVHVVSTKLGQRWLRQVPGSYRQFGPSYLDAWSILISLL